MISVMTVGQSGMSDAALVSASRAGDREAFGQIVRRYQGMVSGLIYAACGDLYRSEDLAQETFLSAWKSLSGLREPAKLPAWLCQIARHRAQDDQRKTRSEKVGVGGFWARQGDGSDATAPPPDAAMIQKEEEAILWRALAEVPQPYRETLVLYYRQEQSTEQVAAAMETSQASVRQRLSRGREMLRGQVDAMLERNLSRSAPGGAFTSAVVAALPMILPEAGKVAGVSTAAKGSFAAAKSGWLTLLTPWLGLAGGLASGVGGSVGALSDDRTPAERRLTLRFLCKIWIAVAILFLGALTLMHLHIRLHWSDDFYVPMLAGWFALYWVVMATVVAGYQARSLEVRGDRPPPNLANGGVAIFSGLSIAVGTAVGSLAWMIHLARLAGDDLGVGVVLLLIAIVSVLNILALARSPRLMIPLGTAAIFGAIVLMLNWRLDLWIAAQRGTDPLQAHVPLWSVDLIAALVVLWILALQALSRRRQTA